MGRGWGGGGGGIAVQGGGGSGAWAVETIVVQGTVVQTIEGQEEEAGHTNACGVHYLPSPPERAAGLQTSGGCRKKTRILCVLSFWQHLTLSF